MRCGCDLAAHPQLDPVGHQSTKRAVDSAGGPPTRFEPEHHQWPSSIERVFDDYCAALGIAAFETLGVIASTGSTRPRRSVTDHGPRPAAFEPSGHCPLSAPSEPADHHRSAAAHHHDQPARWRRRR